MQRMSLIDLSIHLGLYDAELIQTLEYNLLLISLLAGGSLEDALSLLSTSPTYDPHGTKATILHTMTLQYIHFLLSHTLTWHADSTRVVSHRDFDFLLSMMDRFYLHLGYEVTVSISH